MFDSCVACIALSWNDNVSSAYCTAFAGKRERGRKQRDFAPKSALHFVSKLIILQKVESLTSKLIFYYTVLDPFHRSRVFMRIIVSMSFDCMHFACFSFFFALTLKKISDIIGLKSFYVVGWSEKKI